MNRTTTSRDRMIVEHLPLVGFLVSRVMASATHLSRDDLAQAGAVALVQAVDAYDEARGVPFGAYARERILGAIRDEMRAADWAKRSTRQTIKRTLAVQEELHGTLGRQPSTAELASALGVDQATAAEQASLANRRIGPFDETFAGSESADVPLPDTEIMVRERVDFVRHAVQALPERLRYVVEAIYLEDRTVTELAAELGVTHSAVSQQRTEALRLLRLGTAGYHDQEQLPQETPAAATGRARRYLDELAGRLGVPAVDHVH
ncbi:sigma-70 family RNA polymerase sigma factor [Agromyces sp. G08B096]|uniref:Sigma-70 family RNA polymerase sigma factor n=1 Tax=Agromyces sp. G08B096 TaxID=3156399 RepID=A0AAU7W996_9MICO